MWETCPRFLHGSDLAGNRTEYLWYTSPTLYQKATVWWYCRLTNRCLSHCPLLTISIIDRVVQYTHHTRQHVLVNWYIAPVYSCVPIASLVPKVEMGSQNVKRSCDQEHALFWSYDVMFVDAAYCMSPLIYLVFAHYIYWMERRVLSVNWVTCRFVLTVAIQSLCHAVVFLHGLQEGWLSPTERASVSAISLRHIWPPLYTPR